MFEIMLVAAAYNLLGFLHDPGALQVDRQDCLQNNVKRVLYHFASFSEEST
jgi:hypothetical protein